MDDPLPSFFINSPLLQITFLQPTLAWYVVCVVMLLLLAVSAMISASEVAFFSISPTQKNFFSESKSNIHKAILKLLEKPKTLLATILITNNFVNVAIIILSTIVINGIADFSHHTTLHFIIQVFAVTSLLLLFGEIIPKIYATKDNQKVVELLAYPLQYFIILFYPFSFILVKSTNVIDKRIKKRGHNISVDELSHALELNPEIASSEDEHKILQGIVKFGDTNVRQVMKYRTDVSAIEYHSTFDKVLSCILDCGYSRLPVFSENLDTIKGVLYIKDILPFLEEKANFDWQKLIRHAFFVPENKKLDDLLKDFQSRKMHMAIVVDEYGGTSGIVTLEDVLEEIVGDISDEFDDEDISYSKLDENTFIFEGKITLNDFYRIFEIEEHRNLFEERKGESDTLAGLIIELAGKIPHKNEKIKLNGYTFIIEASDRRKVKRIKVSKINEN
ncbi:MAG: gliding motility-associated protein GldE [Flavobacteriales bacterium]|nr:gliding motility-associated protein GldE [Flavobacteriales bacterium]